MGTLISQEVQAAAPIRPVVGAWRNTQAVQPCGPTTSQCEALFPPLPRNKSKNISSIINSTESSSKVKRFAPSTSTSMSRLEAMQLIRSANGFSKSDFLRTQRISSAIKNGNNRLNLSKFNKTASSSSTSTRESKGTKRSSSSSSEEDSSSIYSNSRSSNSEARAVPTSATQHIDLVDQQSSTPTGGTVSGGSASQSKSKKRVSSTRREAFFDQFMKKDEASDKDASPIESTSSCNALGEKSNDKSHQQRSEEAELFSTAERDRLQRMRTGSGVYNVLVGVKDYIASIWSTSSSCNYTEQLMRRVFNPSSVCEPGYATSSTTMDSSVINAEEFITPSGIAAVSTKEVPTVVGERSPRVDTFDDSDSSDDEGWENSDCSPPSQFIESHSNKAIWMARYEITSDCIELARRRKFQDLQSFCDDLTKDIKDCDDIMCREVAAVKALAARRVTFAASKLAITPSSPPLTGHDVWPPCNGTGLKRSGIADVVISDEDPDLKPSTHIKAAALRKQKATKTKSEKARLKRIQQASSQQLEDDDYADMNSPEFDAKEWADTLQQSCH